MVGEPTVNASLNAVSAGLLIAGYRCIRKRRILAHQRCMLSAFAVSTCFLVSYLTYHFHPGVGSVRFSEPAWARPFYLAVLIPHVILAIPVVPAALIVVYFAWRRSFRRHAAVARVALPIWLYVSISGVLVYLLLYVFFPQHHAVVPLGAGSG